MPSRRSWLFLLLILALAAGLRFYRIDAQSLWSDEGSSVAQALRDIPAIAANAARDIHPPFYYILLHFWVMLFGASEAGVRSLSAVLGVALVALVYWLGRALWDERTALAAALLAAVNPFQIYYAQEARMYMLMAVLGALCVGSTVASVTAGRERNRVPRAASQLKPGAERREGPEASVTSRGEGWRAKWGWYGLYGAAAVAGLYTHYFFPILLVVCNLAFFSELLFLALSGRAHPGNTSLSPARTNLSPGNIAAWLSVQVGVLLCFAPWLPVALRQLGAWPSGALTFTAADAPVVILRTLGAGLSAPPGDAPWLLLFALLLLLGALPRRGAMRLDGFRPVVMALLYLALPVAAIYALGLFKDAFLKFIVVAAPPFALLLASGVLQVGSLAHQLSAAPGERVKRRERHREAAADSPLAAVHPELADTHRSPHFISGLPFNLSLPKDAPRKSQFAILITLLALVLTLLPSALSLRSYYFDPRFARDDYRAIAQTVEALGRRGDGIILDAPGQAEIFRYYYQGDLPVYPLPRQRPPDEAATADELQKLAAAHGRLFVVLWATDESDPARLVETWLDAHTFKSTDSWYGNVRLAMYASLPPAIEPQTRINMRWGDDVTLLGYTLGAGPVDAGSVLPLTLFWRAERPIARRYKVFVHLLDPRGFVIAQRDSEPVGGSRPVNSWKAGETIADPYGLFVPFALPPLAYQVEIGLYELDSGARLKNAAGLDHFVLPAVSVRVTTSPRAIPGMLPLGLALDSGLTLVGYQLEKVGAEGQRQAEFRAGDSVHLTLYWRRAGIAMATGEYRLRLGDFDRQGPPSAGLYPLSRWAEGELVRDDQIIPLAGLQPGTHALSINGRDIAGVVIR